MKRRGPRRVIVSADFDNFRSHHVRLLHEASRLGPVTVLLWSDRMIESMTGKKPKLPVEERIYLIEAIRYVDRIIAGSAPFDPNELPVGEMPTPLPDMWVVPEESQSEKKRDFCDRHEIQYRVIGADEMHGFPQEPEEVLSDFAEDRGGRPPRVLVTGCFDWFHSGHVRFFEEAAEYGDLIVVVGHDANVRLLKGEGHPLFSQDERRYMIQAVRYVKAAVISTGHGWMDAEPEVERFKPDRYLANEDGDKPEKRRFCKERNIEYIVLKRKPREGLIRRTSTTLRGF